MIGADANILIRLVLQDDADQLARVRSALEAALARGEQVRIGPVALVETAWTLSSVKKLPKAALSAAIRGFAETPPFVLFDEEIVGEALDQFETAAAGFSDCLIRAMDKAEGCTSTLTFDRNALKLPGFAHP